MLTQEFLQARKRQLLGKEQRVLDDLKSLADRPVDQRIRHKRDVLLPRIAAALKRIEKGNYGECPDCEEEIPQKRLEARPEAVRCFTCQSAREAADERS